MDSPASSPRGDHAAHGRAVFGNVSQLLADLLPVGGAVEGCVAQGGRASGAAAQAGEEVLAAYELGDESPPARPIVLETIG